MSYEAAVAASAAAVVAQAIKASGAIVRVEPQDFMAIISRVEKPLVVMAERKFIKFTYRYLTAYKGLVFSTKTNSPLQLPGTAELVIAKQIWIPT